jgi:hypothetical protein
VKIEEEDTYTLGVFFYKRINVIFKSDQRDYLRHNLMLSSQKSQIIMSYLHLEN